MKIVVSCHKDDFFLSKICIASIDYYHPNAEIFLLKDFSNGKFDSTELEKTFNVQVLDLGIHKFGWGAAKMHLLLSDIFPGEKILMIDSDIVFLGPVLNKLVQEAEGFDFVVSPEAIEHPYGDWFKATYYDMEYLNKVDPGFTYPGYVFNTGQMVVTTGKLKKAEMANYFDSCNYPYWQVSKEFFPTVDQSVLNYVLPRKEQHNEIKIRKLDFMFWSERGRTDHITLKQVTEDKNQEYLIHWAGAKRVPYLKIMSRSDVLFFFEDYYYSKVKFGTLKKGIWRGKVLIKHHKRKLIDRTKAVLGAK